MAVGAAFIAEDDGSGYCFGIGGKGGGDETDAECEEDEETGYGLTECNHALIFSLNGASSRMGL